MERRKMDSFWSVRKMTKEEMEKELELEERDFKFKIIERLSGFTIFALSIVFGFGLFCLVGVLGMLTFKFMLLCYGILF